ncbi:ammonia-forming cytochrome c nitrite reductase subunit c552 [Albimonas sp. CAU 1670]|uniref:ammonia-forming cytochrome c nitrite reductase subunit c552 n=1 Tax=Albimonas sp. CAU 1670 TaxID=3032599 RepID=UPI0023DA0B0D|nr:ammonia-forming cytochrome c nitrite reductase subunit c552 [Albimonas sp. CAU 1670]MDF2232891.1 ammonia-forming cytochrome c nitrite reductase subunit c552 [Albimonas sp. CAU 1670]
MRTPLLWLLWTALTLAGAAAVAAAVFIGGDRTPLLLGETTGVHAQFETACESCHGAEPLAPTTEALKALNEGCRNCHDAELKVSDDSHPRKKFRDPRMADYWAKLDARDCTTCHIEHEPELTRPGAVTLAMDYCVACHAEGEQNVRAERESHAGLGFETCASAGCHNFHDNRALYEDFLVKHADEPWLLDHPVQARAAALRAPDARFAKPRGAPLTLAQAEAPEGVLARFPSAELEAWAASAHAETGVTCAACHAPKARDTEALAAEWSDAFDLKACAKCHRDEAQTWTEGRHGMAFHAGVAKPRQLDKRLKAIGLKGWEEDLPAAIRAWLADAEPARPMSVAASKLPMKPEAAHQVLTCAACHDPHAPDRRLARVETCASCHDDDHSRAYFASPHYALFLAEMAGEGAPGSGVGCADCHMPKIEDPASGRVFTTHDQNAYLRPNEKMIRPVCMDCHGLGFAIDALADPALVRTNFQGRPAAHVPSIDWAARRATTGEEARQ